MAKQKPKDGEFWVVDRLSCGKQPLKRLVAERITWLGEPAWYVCGDEEACPDNWFKPIRKVRLS